MSLSRRLILTVAASIGFAVVGVAVVLGLLAREALIGQAESQAHLVAGLIAGEANRAGLVSDEIDSLTAEGMEAQAIAIAHLAEGYRTDDPRLAVHLSEITAQSSIDDIWLLDGLGRQLVRAINGRRERDGGSLATAGIDDRVVGTLLSGRRFSVDFQSTPGGWERPMRYVGVRFGENRPVLLGSLAGDYAAALETIGLDATLSSLAEQPGVRMIWVVDDQLRELGAVSAEDGAMLGLTPADKELAKQALRTGVESFLGDDALHVAAPILDRGGVATGAAILHMPRDRLDQLFADYVVFGLLVATLAFAVGSLIAMVSARRIARPVMALTQAAGEMDDGRFEPGSLDRAAGRGDELGTLVRVFQSMARAVQAREEHLEHLVRERTLDLEQKNAQLEDARKRTKEELDIARSLQGAILPKTMPSHEAYAGHALMTPAWEMGGDFYDFFTLPDGRLGLVIADVSGKGVPAAFFMAIARTVMRTAAHDHPETGACMREVNNTICSQNPHGFFVTVFYGILDPASGRFDFANAGHNPPYLVRAAGAVEALPMTGGVAIGMFEGLDYGAKETMLDPGDTLFLYTDGISEAMNAAGEIFAEERIEKVLASGNQLPVDAMINRVTGAVEIFVGEAPQSDDITCVVLRYREKEREAA